MLIRGILDEDKGASQIRALKSEKASLTAEREATVESVPDLAVHPAIADNYLASLGKLEDALRGPEGPSEAHEFSAVRDLVEAITVTPDANGSKPQIEVAGDLARFLAPSGYSSGGKVVAEEGAAASVPKGPVLLGSKRRTVDHCVPPQAVACQPIDARATPQFTALP